jgi:hypothetical protein
MGVSVIIAVNLVWDTMHVYLFSFCFCAQGVTVLQTPPAKAMPVPINWLHIATLGHAVVNSTPPVQLKPLILAARVSVSNGELTAEDPRSHCAGAIERRSLHHLAIAAQAVLQLGAHEARIAAAALERGAKAARQCVKDNRSLDADVEAAKASASKVWQLHVFSLIRH